MPECTKSAWTELEERGPMESSCLHPPRSRLRDVPTRTPEHPLHRGQLPRATESCPLCHTVNRQRILQQETGHTLERDREQRPRVTENVLNVLVPVPVASRCATPGVTRTSQSAPRRVPVREEPSAY